MTGNGRGSAPALGLGEEGWVCVWGEPCCGQMVQSPGFLQNCTNFEGGLQRSKLTRGKKLGMLLFSPGETDEKKKKIPTLGL